jgi:hypothetical protein
MTKQNSEHDTWRLPRVETAGNVIAMSPPRPSLTEESTPDRLVERVPELFDTYAANDEKFGEPFSRTYPNGDTPCLGSGSCFTEGSFTQPFRHRASAPRSTGVVPVRGTPGQVCSVLPHPRSGAVPDHHDGLGFRQSGGELLHHSGYAACPEGIV